MSVVSSPVLGRTTGTTDEGPSHAGRVEGAACGGLIDVGGTVVIGIGTNGIGSSTTGAAGGVDVVGASVVVVELVLVVVVVDVVVVVLVVVVLVDDSGAATVSTTDTESR